MSPDALVLFAGGGGSTLGIHQAGLSTLSIEMDADACATLRAAGFDVVQADVTTLRPGQYQGSRLLQASPPCQPFSAAGKRTGNDDLSLLFRAIKRIGDYCFDVDHIAARLRRECSDPRSALTFEALRWIDAIWPEYVWLEQVPGVLPIWEAIAASLKQQFGYNVWTGCLHAERHGVPQTRKRAILCASLYTDAKPPEPTHSRYYPRTPERLDEGVKPWVSMAEALGWGLDQRPSPTVTAGGAETGGAEPIAHLRRYFPTVAVPGDTSWTKRRPSPTVVGSFAPDVVAAPGWRKPGDGPHQRAPGSGRISVTEAAILQGFPADWPWHGTRTSQYRQVGNAVPPPLAEAITTALLATNDEEGIA